MFIRRRLRATVRICMFARWVKPDVVVSAAGCRIDEHLEQWSAKASSEPVIPDRLEVAPEATSTDTSH